MIEINKYQKVLDTGLLLDHYFLLITISKGMEVVKNKRIQGFYNLLSNKGYIDEGVLTQSAKDLIGNDLIVSEISEENKDIAAPVATQKPSFTDWVMNVHGKCQKKLIELTGSPQVRSSINGGKSYPFLANAVDLAKVITTVVTKYKLKDMELIERCILQHIEDCYRKKSWFPLMRYYIQKDGNSTLATDVLNPKSTEGSKDFGGRHKLL